MQAFFEWSHETLGWCFYTIPTLVVGLLMVILGLVHTRKQNKREDDFKDEMKELGYDVSAMEKPEAEEKEDAEASEEA